MDDHVTIKITAGSLVLLGGVTIAAEHWPGGVGTSFAEQAYVVLGGVLVAVGVALFLGALADLPARGLALLGAIAALLGIAPTAVVLAIALHSWAPIGNLLAAIGILALVENARRKRAGRSSLVEAARSIWHEVRDER